MHLRKFMHPRNKYKEEPNFKELALLYPEFRKVAMTDLSGKVRLNFKDDESLRVLTKILLRHDFGIEVEIPESKLIPALSLRLNYVLWIEDLLIHSGLNDMRLARGIDIGTGAVCIYPLLFAKLYGCKMIASEIDLESIKSAEENINRNNMQELIKVISVPKETILSKFVNNEENYSFVMCNPPFFKTDHDLKKINKRLPPRNASSGKESELIVEGGEIAFIMRLIDDSMILKEKIQIYTSMIGVKKNLLFLRSELKNRNIENVTWTEFCQGFTKRWGIAWSFLPESVLNLSTAPTIRKNPEYMEKKKYEKPPFDIIFPPHGNLKNLQEVIASLKSCVRKLNIQLKEIQFEERENLFWACQLTTDHDSWCQARRKRRMSLQLESASKKIRNSVNSESQSFSASNIVTQKNEKTLRLESDGPFLEFILLLYLIQSDGEINEDNSQFKISLIFESGSGGRNALESFRQFLVNKLNVREYFQKQFKSKKK
ncbi:U6 small nuclear RNA (adenine-(43)-N(6))-methyltransferase [Leptopilina heterotoma]|uniref:U6 small nuclear RNA (adenine-(43)-N(6))-methyltransferase n=1 Tax=Leptopilina heterotoma TaxID=63436 RepID=UPI001CA8C8E5|nr:U6 small nuclear RNA (adenine-(43)-N(6))-methyltransferase [Leptopilina heterotoma]